jgi:acetylornithine deacetylase
VTSSDRIAPGDARELATALVRIDSRNPSLAPGAPGEAPCVALLRDVLQSWGFRTEVHDAAPGRPNLLARIGAASSGRTLMLSGHLDVVGVEGMVHEPFAGTISAGRLHGRGATDMKGGIGAMCAAAWRAAHEGLTGEIIIAATADEEFESIGTRAMLERGVRADAAIVGEPTCLDIMPAHRGFVWVEVVVSGRAAHGSRWDIGVDAIRHAGLLLAELDRVDAEDLPRREHPLLGRGSLHASEIEGGIGMSTYPDRCVVRLERRTLPGETGAEVVAEVERACDAVRARRASFDASVRLLMAQGPSDVRENAMIVRELGGALRDCSEEVRVSGMSAWTDAALLNAAGIPAVCFGPGDISLAHAAAEYIPLHEIDRATAVLAALAQRWCA